MDKRKGKKAEPDISPEVRSWIDNVIVPALVDEFLSEVSGKDQPGKHPKLDPGR